VVAALLVVMAIHLAPPADALRWAAISILFASVVPMAYVLTQVRRRRISDRHVRIRVQRRLPMLVAIVSTIGGLGVLYALGAPRPLLALAAAGVAGLCVTAVITLFWKISLHVAVLAGAVTIVVVVFGLVWLPLVFVVALVAWARVELGDHTMAEVTAGASAAPSRLRFTGCWPDRGQEPRLSLAPGHLAHVRALFQLPGHLRLVTGRHLKINLTSTRALLDCARFLAATRTVCRRRKGVLGRRGPCPRRPEATSA
jgi:hypothetical protein